MKLKSHRSRKLFFLALGLLLFFCAGGVNAQKKHLPTALVDLNTASAAELQQVPGVGPAHRKINN